MYSFEKYKNNAVCELFNSGRSDELDRSAFVTVKYRNPLSLIFQHIPMNEMINIPSKNNILEENVRSRKGVIIGTSNSLDIVEIVKCGGIVLEVYEGFFCHILQ